MAHRVQTLFTDDIDGSAAEGTVRFALDGTEHEIDLNADPAGNCGTPWQPACGRPDGSAATCPRRAHGTGERAE